MAKSTSTETMRNVRFINPIRCSIPSIMDALAPLNVACVETVTIPLSVPLSVEIIKTAACEKAIKICIAQ